MPDAENAEASDDGTEVIRFDESDTTDVVARMHQLLETRDGWVNLRPILTDENGESPAEMPPVRAGVLGLFSGRGPDVPVATWVPGVTKRRGTEADTIGIQHGSGPKTARRLREAGITAPDSWRVLADHPKRGLVVQLPADTDPGDVLAWLIRASVELSRYHLMGKWAAVVHIR